MEKIPLSKYSGRRNPASWRRKPASWTTNFNGFQNWDTSGEKNVRSQRFAAHTTSSANGSEYPASTTRGDRLSKPSTALRFPQLVNSRSSSRPVLGYAKKSAAKAAEIYRQMMLKTAGRSIQHREKTLSSREQLSMPWLQDNGEQCPGHFCDGNVSRLDHSGGIYAVLGKQVILFQMSKEGRKEMSTEEQHRQKDLVNVCLQCAQAYAAENRKREERDSPLRDTVPRNRFRSKQIAVASRHAQLLGDRYESQTRVKSKSGYLSPIRAKGKSGYVSPTHAEGKSDYLSPTRVKSKPGYLSPTRASILKSAVKASSKNRRRRQRKTSPRVRRAAQRAAQRKHGLSSSPPTLPRLRAPRPIASEQVEKKTQRLDKSVVELLFQARHKEDRHTVQLGSESTEKPAASATTALAACGPCKICDCAEFIPNAFLPKRCDRCAHGMDWHTQPGHADTTKSRSIITQPRRQRAEPVPMQIQSQARGNFIWHPAHRLKDATKIQSQARGKLARNTAQTQSKAATKIQSQVRGKLARNTAQTRSKAATEIQSEDRSKAATKIQSQMRGKLARDTAQTQSKAATKIQSQVRGKLARNTAQTRSNAATKIESQARRKLATKQFTQRKHATQNSRKIQSQWRAHMARKNFGDMQRVRHDASVVAQRVWRRKMVRNHLRQQHDAATQLQTRWRGLTGRRQATAARRKVRAQRLQRFLSRRRRSRLHAAAVQIQRFFREHVIPSRRAAIVDGAQKIFHCVRKYQAKKKVVATPFPLAATKVLRDTLTTLVDDSKIQDVIGSFWTALPGVANAPEPFLLRDSATPIPSIDMQAFLTIEQIFHLALTPEDEVTKTTGGDVSGNWKRYVAANAGMDRAAFTRYVLGLISSYVKPMSDVAQKQSVYSPASFLALLNALYKATVIEDADAGDSVSVQWVSDVLHTELLQCLCTECSAVVLSSPLRGAELTEKFQRMADQCLGSFKLTDAIKNSRRLTTLELILEKVLSEGGDKLIRDCDPRVVRLEVTSKAKNIVAGSTLRQHLDAIVGEYSALDAVEPGMRLAAKLEVTLPVWKLQSDKSMRSAKIPYIFATTDLRWHFSDLNFDFSRFTSTHAAKSPFAVTSWNSFIPVDVSVVATEETVVKDAVVPTRTKREVPLLKLDQYGHLLRHTLQDVDVDLNNLDMDLDAQLDAIDTVSQFVERRGELEQDFFTVALSTLREVGVFQDDCLMEWFDDTMDIVDKQPPLQSLLEAATPWFESLLQTDFEDDHVNDRIQLDSSDDDDWDIGMA